jgi:hypothetical protein
VPGIFINYRREDAPGVAGRLYDYLAKSFARSELFIDVDAIKPGLDFVKQLDSQVAHCDAMLALIGPHWLNDEQGRRLHGDKDYVRIEIASALRRDIPVIPVLVDGADMPAEDALPDDLKSLARRQALELRHTRFASDAEAIASALKLTLPKRRRKRWLWAFAGGAALLVGLGVVLFDLWPGPLPPEPESPSAPSQTFDAVQEDNFVLQGLGQTADLHRTGPDSWQWSEIGATFTFRTVSETALQILIYDAGRDIYHRLDLVTGDTFWRVGAGTRGEDWKPHYRITSKTTTRIQIFNEPAVDGLPLDGCQYFAKDCGAPAATAWCQSKGFAKAVTFTGYRTVPNTTVIGDGATCTTGPGLTCGTFFSITCGE